MEKLIAYRNDPAVKSAILAQLARHRAADELVKGQYWERGKGCAVGCTIYSGNHAEYEPRFGIPQILARLEDRIFEHLPNALAKEWPERFMGAIRPGADLSGVWPKLAVWLLVDPDKGVIRFAKTAEQRAVIQEVADLYAEGETDREVWRAAWRKARDAAYAAADAAAAYAYAADAAADADAAYAAAYAADAYAADADADAREQYYIAMSDKLVELLEAA